MNHVIVASGPLVTTYIRFTISSHKCHVFCVQPAMLKKKTILSFEQCTSCRALAVERVRQNANSEIRGAPKVDLGRTLNTSVRVPTLYITYPVQYLRCYDALILGSIF